jgi:O-antigen/teichoic acid export membrane protein
MSHSKFYSSLVLLIVLNAIIKPLWIFGIDRQVQNITGVAEYGVYFALYNLSIVFNFLLDWGLTNFINRELAAKKTDLQHQLGSFLFLKLAFALVYVLVVITIAFLSGVRRWDIVWGVVIIQFLTFLFVFLRSIVTANQWFKTDSWLSVLDKTLMICVCSGFIFLPSVFGLINIDKFLVAQASCTTAAVIITLSILLYRGVYFKKPQLRFFNRSVIVSVLPFAVTLFLMSMHIRLDGFLLERLHPNGAHEAGIYAAAYRLLDASAMVGYLIASFFMPFVARLWTEHKPLQRTIMQNRHLQLMFAITIVSVVIILAPWLQKVLYHRVDNYGATVLQWCLSSLIGYALVSVYGTIMTATGDITSFCWLNLVAVIVNVALNLVLIPRYGALGCCYSALFTQLMLGCLTLRHVHKRFASPVDIFSISVYLLNGTIICSVLYFLLKASVNILFLFPLAMLITFLVMWATKMFSINTWLNILKKQ